MSAHAILGRGKCRPSVRSFSLLRRDANRSVASGILASVNCAFLLITRQVRRTSSDGVSLVGRVCSCSIRGNCNFCYLASSPRRRVRL